MALLLLRKDRLSTPDQAVAKLYRALGGSVFSRFTIQGLCDVPRLRDGA